MFDSNAMLELAHFSRDRYQRAGGGGATKVYNTAKAYDDARGYREMSPFRRAAYEATIRWRQVVRNAKEDFRCECWIDVDGRYMSDGIPF